MGFSILDFGIANGGSKNRELSFFRLADLVAEFGGPLVVFEFDGTGKFFTELGDIDEFVFRLGCGA
jgi:hypothetical protein